MMRNGRRTRPLAVAVGAGLAFTALLPAPSRADQEHRSDRANEVHAEQGPPPAAAPPQAAPPADPPAAQPSGPPPVAAAPAHAGGSAAEPQGPPPGPPPAPEAQGAQDAPAPGNAGTVKIHDAETPDTDRRNEPHVCEFRIVGFGFPADADLEISIIGHGGPNAGADGFTASVPSSALSPEGDWAVAGPALADGMYKLAVENTTAPGGAKQKVFKVDCDDVPVGELAPAPGSVGSVDGGTGTGTGTGSVLGGTLETGGGGTSSGTTDADATDVRVLSGSATRAAEVAAAASAAPPVVTEVAGSRLARTGAGLLALVTAGLALLVGGTALLRRTARPA